MATKTSILARAANTLAATALAVVLGGGVVSAETIKLGFIGPVSGGNAQQGLGAQNGFLLAIQQANEGDYPYEVEGVVLDDASDPSVGVSAALKLVNDPQVVAATGHWNSPVALATIPVFNRYNMPFIVWGAISPKITEQNLPNVTRVTPTLTAENKPLAEWVATEAGVTKIAIVSDTSDYGASNLQSFQEFFEAAGGEVVASESAAVGTTDFRALLTTVKSANPEAIYFGGVITEAGLVRKQMADLGMDIPMFGISGFYDPEFISIAGEAAEGTMVSYPAAASNEAYDQMNEAYEAAGFEEPQSPYTKYAFDAANILLQVIEEHGIEDKEALSQAIREISYDGAVGTTTFDETGQTQVPVEIEIKEVKGGEWVNHE